HRRREAAETRNQAEQLVYQTEKFLKDNEDKVPGEIRTEVEGAVAELKDKLKAESGGGDKTAEIRTATEKLAAVSQKLGQAMYASAQAQQAAAGGGAGDAGAFQAKAEDDVVDAEIVDDDKQEGAAG
ncbi:Hsp70 family protein, partial [Streptomyces sp. NPDC059909]|uniref:Hsp70 family protein n=1 Tax=Streptomyces sp. NPDC059909 TaxID=3346998 RepID=UPI003668405A